MAQDFLNLSNICGGKLEEDFQRLYQAIVGQLRQKEAGKITIGIDFKRVENTDTMMDIKYSITPKFPPNKRASMTQICDGGKLKTELPPPVPNLALFKTEVKNEATAE